VPLSNQNSKEHLSRPMINITDSMPNSVSASSSVILDEDRRPLESRLREPNEIEHVTTDVHICGLLVDDLSAPGTCKIGHKGTSKNSDSSRTMQLRVIATSGPT